MSDCVGTSPCVGFLFKYVVLILPVVGGGCLVMRKEIEYEPGG